MHAHFVLAHPEPTSFNSHLVASGVETLTRQGWTATVSDLYAMGFDPSERAEFFADRLDGDRFDVQAEQRHASQKETLPVDVAEELALMDRADLLILQYPMWWHLPPAMLKGWFDRLFGPGIAMDLTDPAQVKPLLKHIQRITGISTYGRPRWQAIGIGDPPRRIIKRYLPWFTGGNAKVRYHALYHMNTATAARRGRFLAKVRCEMERL